MGYKDEKCECIQIHIEEAKDKLINQEVISEQECILLAKEIQNISDKKEKTNEEMTSLNIDELYKEFSDCAEKSKIILENILATISSGCIPDYSKRKEFNDGIDTMSAKYDLVCKVAQDTLSEDEIPELGSSIDVYYGAIKNSKTLLLQSQINEIKSILERFVSVQSLVANLMLALEPFQKNAKTLIEKIGSGEAKEYDEIAESAAGPQLFMQALELQELNSDEGNDLLDNLEEKYSYPSRVTRGLSSKRYFIPDELNSDLITQNESNGFYKEEHENDLKSEKIKKSTDSSNITKVEETKEEVVTEAQIEKSKFTLLLEAEDVVVEESKFGILSSEISPSETKKVSASVFTSDLRKGNVKVFKNIIQQIDKFLLLSPEILYLRYHMPENIAEINLAFLVRKGYLRKYKVIPGGEFYCSSPRLDKALTYKEASKFVEVKQYHADQLDEIIEDKASSASARISLLKLYENSSRNYSNGEVKKYLSKKSLMTESFLFRTYDSENLEEIELLGGAFWTNYNECNEFIEKLESFIEKNEHICRFVFAAIDKKIALSIVRAIKECNFVNLENTLIAVYAVNEDKYYSDFENEIAVGDIWPALSENDDEETQEISGNVDLDEEIKIEDIVSDDEERLVSGEQSSKNTVLTFPTRNSAEVESSKNVDDIIYSFFVARKYYCASAYAKVFSINNDNYCDSYDRIAYALNDPMKHCVYSADSVFDMIPEEHDCFSDSLMVAIGLRTFFSNQVRYDYNIKAFYNAIKEYSLLNDYPALNNVLYKLVDFKDSQKKGMDMYADYHVKSVAQLDDEIRNVQKEARLFYDSIIMGKKSEKASQRRFLDTKKLLFDSKGDIGQYIKAVVDNDKEFQPLIVDFLQSNFIDEGNTVSVDNINSNLLWNYIMVFWEQAGEEMSFYRRAKLMSHLRSNIVNATTKALQIMICWCNVVEKTYNQVEDTSTNAYKKIRKPLLNDIKEAITLIEDDVLSNELLSKKEKAGLEAIRFALDEISRCVEGTYEEYERKLFYSPFLLSDDVILDEGFYPDLENKAIEVRELLPEYRIAQHANKHLISPDERLKEIMDDGGDDYGTARMIVEYLKIVSPNTNIEEIEHNIEDGEAYVKETANLKKSQFVGDLELAQSYGQIDNSNSSEDKKEKILQIVESWYEWACNNSNYGFFEKVMDGYLDEIRREAKYREKDLIAQFEMFKGTSINGLTVEAKEKKIAKIQSALTQQNYTVVEDLLARAFQIDDEHDDIIDEDFLKDFLEEFDDYYKPVAMSQTSFATLVSKRTRNKEERGGKRLAENWLPGGSNLGKDRLTALLSGFGFRVDADSIQTQSPIGRFENFNVKTISEKDGKRDNYTHPISAFGSGASQDGFRVVCLNGKYDAVGLIDVMKKIGNAKHTMILLDSAIDKPERRILARKSKTELGDKLFVVVDRTVMMYMVKNYDETKANRMLMALVTPFGYYQPYVWESSNVMPPEIFMGRKHELERIESPTGANIVYGGRQLGKSALLKKAKADIDGDENGNRAILVEIKGLDYKSAAKKIGHALFDEGVLTEDIETEDWEDLSRIIRRRLQSEKNRIQYLLLLLDEADSFIESCEKINYRPFDALKEVQSIGTGRFKFVIAGLRNIVRFKRDAALGNNSVLTHLEAMTVKPFQPTEARELMEIPLHYLGLEFPKENESLITLILATTNYFPGLIQMYCAKLLSAMRNKDYAGYDETDTPIYEISEEHIKKVLADSEFMDQIREKFFITLKLDEDNYYYLIALIIAYLYHNNGYNDGYSVSDIKEVGKSLDIAKIAGLDDNKLLAFMEEMKELNVLRSTDDNHYLFTRFSFFQMIGTSSEVDDKLVKYMGV